MESFRRGIFRRPRNAWLAVAVYTSLLYATLTLVYDGYIWAFERIGPDWMSRGLNSAYFVAGLALLAFASLRGRRGLQAWAALAMIAGSAAFCLWLEEVPANRLHLMQYAPLAIFGLDALRTRLAGGRLYAAVLVLVFAIGCGDELLQSLLPNRRFDPRDVALNLTAGALALLFVAVVLGPENYPWGRSPNRQD